MQMTSDYHSTVMLTRTMNIPEIGVPTYQISWQNRLLEDPSADFQSLDVIFDRETAIKFVRILLMLSPDIRALQSVTPHVDIDESSYWVHTQVEGSYDLIRALTEVAKGLGAHCRVS